MIPAIFLTLSSAAVNTVTFSTALSARTHVYGLRDIQAVQRTDNYYRKYLGGVFGGGRLPRSPYGPR
jgi:hypothetical protein